MTNKLVVIINNLKIPKIKKILLYEMKFLLPNYSCLQNPWLGGYCPQIPVLSVLCPQLNLLNPPPQKKISWLRHCFLWLLLSSSQSVLLNSTPPTSRRSRKLRVCLRYYRHSHLTAFTKTYLSALWKSVYVTVYWTHVILVPLSLILVTLLTLDILTFWLICAFQLLCSAWKHYWRQFLRILSISVIALLWMTSSNSTWDTFNEICCCGSYTRPDYTNTVGVATLVFIFTSSVLGKDTLSWFRFCLCNWRCDFFGRMCSCECCAHLMTAGIRLQCIFFFFRISVIWTFGLDVLTFFGSRSFENI